ncbi:hypothetical protein FRC03_011014 [Tulasnella sp. 419]|nr:hypothetical protein FRC03_011014 [Tulasnella sp. 419]
MAGSPNPSSSVSTPSPTTRTLAIIKNHALPHRFEIESRITSSAFEVVKERQMKFHPDDPNVAGLFDHEGHSLCGAPVWVYVLERRKAVEVWNTLIGDEDPEVARINAPDSIRALYGTSILENAVYGSPNGPMAEIQISSLFASSPPMPVTILEDEVPAGPVLETSSVPSLSGGEESTTADEGSPNVKLKSRGFKARPVPATIAVPSIAPRLSRAAALRAGLPVQEKRRSLATKESIAKTFENVPGHKRAATISVASTAAPTIPPRQTRASALRTSTAGQDVKKGPVKKEPTRPRGPNSPERIQQIFANVPGHKRRQTIAVTSTAPPPIAPRPTRASMLRTGQGDASPTKTKPRASTMPSSHPSSSKGKAPTASSTSEKSVDGDRPSRRLSTTTFEGVPGHKRSETIEVPSTRPPTTAPRSNRSAELRQLKRDGKAPPSSFRGNSSNNVRPASSQGSLHPPSSTNGAAAPRSASAEPGQASGRKSVAAAPRPPSITPRSNKSALLRAKMGTPTATSAPKVFAF